MRLVEIFGVDSTYAGLAPRQVRVVHPDWPAGMFAIPLYCGRDGMWLSRIFADDESAGKDTYLSALDSKFGLQPSMPKLLEVYEVLVFDGGIPQLALLSAQALAASETGHYQRTGRVFKLRCTPDGIPTTLVEVLSE